MLEGGRACRLIDVREFPEFAAGHVPGAEPIPLGTLPGVVSSIDKSRPVIVLCKSGKRARRAAEILNAAGCSEVLHVQGGTDAWIADGLPVEREAKAPWSLERQVRFTAGLLVLIGLFIPPWPYLSAFIGAGLVFAAVTDTCGMGMMLAKMPWNRNVGACPSAECSTTSAPSAKKP